MPITINIVIIMNKIITIINFIYIAIYIYLYKKVNSYGRFQAVPNKNHRIY